MLHTKIEGDMNIEKTHWKTLWEDNADQEKKTFDLMAVSDLLEMVKNENYGEYYSIWASISERADVKQAGFILLAVLYGDSSYTLRANCASALLTIMDEKTIRSVDVSADRPDQSDFLKLLEKKIKILLKT